MYTHVDSAVSTGLKVDKGTRNRMVHAPRTFFSLYMQFCGVMDLLSLPAVTARLHSSSPAIHDEEGEDTQGMEITSKEIEQGSHVGSESPLLLSWKRLQSVLGCTLSEALRLKDHDSYQLLHCLELSCGIKKSSQFQIRRRVDIFSAMCVQLSRTMSMLLTAASDKELHFIIEQLLCIKIHVCMYTHDISMWIMPIHVMFRRNTSLCLQ